MKVKVKKIKFNDYVPRGVFEQVRWEKDIAMQQLEELGVSFGAKPELYAKPIIHAHWEEQNDATHFCSRCGNDATYTYEGKELVGFLCPFCGAQMDEAVK